MTNKKDIIEFDGIKLDSNTLWKDDVGNRYMKSEDHQTAYMLIGGTDEDGNYEIMKDIVEVEGND
jgi:hypothetical protein